jgi:hypothetical protein
LILTLGGFSRYVSFINQLVTHVPNEEYLIELHEPDIGSTNSIPKLKRQSNEDFQRLPFKVLHIMYDALPHFIFVLAAINATKEKEASPQNCCWRGGFWWLANHSTG